MKKINVYIGVIGSGKSYRASKENDIVLNYADSLREDVWKLLNWVPSNETEYEVFKNKNLGLITGRELLQNYGQLQKELEGNSYWSNRLLYKLAQEIDNPEIKTIGIADCRFIKEITQLLLFSEDQFIKSLGVSIEFHHCDYKSYKYDTTNPHISETMAQSILNRIKNGTIENLDNHIKTQWKEQRIVSFH